jgi:hypothetical protein
MDLQGIKNLRQNALNVENLKPGSIMPVHFDYEQDQLPLFGVEQWTENGNKFV